MSEKNKGVVQEGYVPIEKGYQPQGRPPQNPQPPKGGSVVAPVSQSNDKKVNKGK